MDIARDNIKRIRQLEFIVSHLQSRISAVAGSYELEVAMMKSEMEELKYVIEELKRASVDDTEAEI